MQLPIGSVSNAFSPLGNQGSKQFPISTGLPTMARHAERMPNPVTQLQAPQPGMADVAGVQAAASKLGYDALEARSDVRDRRLKKLKARTEAPKEHGECKEAAAGSLLFARCVVDRYRNSVGANENGKVEKLAGEAGQSRPAHDSGPGHNKANPYESQLSSFAKKRAVGLGPLERLLSDLGFDSIVPFGQKIMELHSGSNLLFHGLCRIAAGFVDPFDDIDGRFQPG